MWKDYFYLTKRERTSVWVLTILVTAWGIGGAWLAWRARRGASERV